MIVLDTMFNNVFVSNITFMFSESHDSKTLLVNFWLVAKRELASFVARRVPCLCACELFQESFLELFQGH